MKNKIIVVNLIILLFLSAIFKIAEQNAFDFIINYAGTIVTCIIINLLISLYFYLNKNKELAKTFLLSSGIILLVGFSTCFAVEYLR